MLGFHLASSQPVCSTLLYVDNAVVFIPSVFSQAAPGVNDAKAGRLPAALTRRYDVYFVPEEHIPVSEGKLQPSRNAEHARCLHKGLCCAPLCFEGSPYISALCYLASLECQVLRLVAK